MFTDIMNSIPNAAFESIETAVTKIDTFYEEKF